MPSRGHPLLFALQVERKSRENLCLLFAALRLGLHNAFSLLSFRLIVTRLVEQRKWDSPGEQLPAKNSFLLKGGELLAV